MMIISLLSFSHHQTLFAFILLQSQLGSPAVAGSASGTAGYKMAQAVDDSRIQIGSGKRRQQASRHWAATGIRTAAAVGGCGGRQNGSGCGQQQQLAAASVAGGGSRKTKQQRYPAAAGDKTAALVGGKHQDK